MATYYDKKKLIEDSSDVYISDYDKNLDYSYLSDIIDQKRAYNNAEKVGDAEGMKRANDRANSIRLQAASYTAGADGSKYNRVKRPYEENEPVRKTNSYDKERDNVYKKISSYGDFEYDINEDPLYQTYREIYLALGEDAFDRALSENSLRTGGVNSTSAISAASLAQNKYNTMLSAMIPQLYDKAYSKYKDGLENLYKRLDSANSISDTEYSRYRDDVKDYMDSRDYYYEKDNEIADDLYDVYADDTQLAYDISRDRVNDAQTQDEFEFEKQKHNDNYLLDQSQLAFDRQKHRDNMQQKNFFHITDTETQKMEIALNIAKAVYGEEGVTEDKIQIIRGLLG